MHESIFEDLFVLELANNHWGSLQRGLKIVHDFADVVHRNNITAAVKLQFRDLDTFIHPYHVDRQDSRYIKKLGATRMNWGELKLLVDAVRARGMVTMATPFDEASVDRCVEFGVEILKIASSDIRDGSLIRKMASTGKPVIASSGGASLKDIDDLVAFFAAEGVPFALNHCVSIYPSQDGELELNQIDFLRERYPDTVIGFSSHEMTDWSSSMLIAYAKGARTFERHIDIDFEGVPVSSYCTLPEQADVWFKAFNKAKEMCGGSRLVKRAPPEKEVRYLDELVRGVYAKRDLPAGHVVTAEDVYLAVPLLLGQLSGRELTMGEVLRRPIVTNQPVRLLDVDSPYCANLSLTRMVEARGMPALPPGDEAPLARVAAG